jgi:hypothetical protein
MTDDRTLERAARSWLEEGPTRAPDRAVDAALSRIDTTRQERDLRIPWRITSLNPSIKLAGAAVLVLAVASAVIFAMRPTSNVGPPSSTPVPSPTAAPQASAGDPLVAYRAARNEICTNALMAFSDHSDLVGLYDPATPADRRAIVNANAQGIADAIATEARDLGLLQAPPELAEAHTTDVAHAQSLAAIYAGQMQLLQSERYADAAAQEVAAESASNLRKPFETQYDLFTCP